MVQPSVCHAGDDEKVYFLLSRSCVGRNTQEAHTSKLVLYSFDTLGWMFHIYFYAIKISWRLHKGHMKHASVKLNCSRSGYVSVITFWRIPRQKSYFLLKLYFNVLLPHTIRSGTKVNRDDFDFNWYCYHRHIIIIDATMSIYNSVDRPQSQSTKITQLEQILTEVKNIPLKSYKNIK